MSVPSAVNTTWPGTISASGEANGVLFNVPDLTPSGNGGVTKIRISGTYGTAVLVVEARLRGMSTFLPIAGVDTKALTAVGTGGSITLTDNTSYEFRFPSAFYDEICVYASALGSGSISVEQVSGPAENASPPVVNATTTTTSLAAATTITSTSATALAVGANGTTNPVLKVNASAGSVATGVSITGAAAAGGVAVAATSSGTDENFTLDAKGAGVLNLAGTSTGSVYLNRGALKTPVIAVTVTSLGTTQSSTPTAAQLRGGVVTQTGQTGAGTVTLPSGTAISAAMGLTPVAGDSFDCLFCNLGGSQTLTITGATGSTVIGTAAVGSGKNARMKFVNTGANAWNVYCEVSA